MYKKAFTCLMVLAVVAWAVPGWAGGAVGSISGVVTNQAGDPVRGAMVSAFDESIDMNVTVFTAADGTYEIANLQPTNYKVRARLIGLDDAFVENVTVDAGKAVSGVKFSMKPATDLDAQRLGTNLFSLLKFDTDADKANFKMMCTYCHQVGTAGFRSPEEPVDWETMVSRMDGFGGLFEHTKETIVTRLIEAYSPEAQENWPAYEVPPAPDGVALKAVVTEWDLGREDACMIHDLAVGKNGLIWAVDMTNDVIYSLNPDTGERRTIAIPGGKDPQSEGTPRKGPHSIEAAPNGDMWMTLALSGEMAKYEPDTGEWTVVSGAPAPRPRGAYPHTLRVASDGIVWYTDAGSGVFSLDPKTNEVTNYKLPGADQAVGAGRGESRGRTPYGIDVSPKDGTIWYTKLNGNRVGRIDPTIDGGAAKEWNPPFRGPRRLHVAPDGIVWVPGFGSGVIAKLDPATDDWEVFDLPDKMNRIPYALNIHPETGDVWVCGTGSDDLLRFTPSTKEFVSYRLPSRVTYTREIEFDVDGNLWVCNSNYPPRHIERNRGSLIRLSFSGN